jgi:hypothetical protein
VQEEKVIIVPKASQCFYFILYGRAFKVYNIHSHQAGEPSIHRIDRNGTGFQPKPLLKAFHLWLLGKAPQKHIVCLWLIL